MRSTIRGAPTARAGLGADANLSLLGAALILATVAAPFAATAAVRIALD